MKYQERVNTMEGLKDLYRRVLRDQCIEKYRGYDDEWSYAWNEANNDYIKCEGEVWFDNPSYSGITPMQETNASEDKEKVHHPSHYTYGKIECIDFILDKKLDFPLGNAVKYIVRAGHKSEEGMTDHEKAIEDLNKAIQYIQFEIEHLEGKR